MVKNPDLEVCFVEISIENTSDRNQCVVVKVLEPPCCAYRKYGSYLDMSNRAMKFDTKVQNIQNFFVKIRL